MNILYLTQRPPYPPNKGDKLRAFNEIKYLSKNHTIHLFSLTDNRNDLAYTDDLLQFCKTVDIVYKSSIVSKVHSLLALSSTTPLTLRYFFSRKLEQLINKAIQNENIDVIFVFCSSMAQYVDGIPEIPKIIDFVDIDSEKWKQYAVRSKFPYSFIYQREYEYLKKYEKKIATSYSHCFLVSQKEVDDFHNLVYESPSITALPNGVDLEKFYPLTIEKEENSLVFTGAMDYFANIDAMLHFCSDILPLIRKKIPKIKLYIVGSNPSKEILHLGKCNDNIVVTGFVDKVQPYMARSMVFVAPMTIARGVQNKIIEAMAMGLPVVCSSLGHEGIEAKKGEEILVEDINEQFANQVIKLLSIKSDRAKLSASGHQAIERHYSWDSNLKPIDTLLNQLLTIG